MLMFILGVAAIIGGFFCLLAFGAFTFGSPITFCLMAGFLWGAWKLAGKDWGIARSTAHYEAIRKAKPQPPKPENQNYRHNRTRHPIIGAAVLTSMDDWGDEDVPE